MSKGGQTGSQQMTPGAGAQPMGGIGGGMVAQPYQLFPQGMDQQRSQMMQGLQGVGSQPGIYGGPMSAPNPMMTTGVYNGPFGADGKPAVSPYQPPAISSGGLVVGPDGRFTGVRGGDGTFNPFATPRTPNGFFPQTPEQNQQAYDAALLEKDRSIGNPYSPNPYSIDPIRPMTPKPTNVWGSYGFDQPLTDYLNNQAMLSATDAAPSWRYDPATKMFTGYGMRGVQQQLSLADMQQRAASRPLINPYGPSPAGAVFGDARPVFEQPITGVYNGPFGANGLPSATPIAGGDELRGLLTGIGTPMPTSLPTAASPPMPALSPREQQREREKAWWADRERRQAARVAMRNQPKPMPIKTPMFSNPGFSALASNRRG